MNTLILTQESLIDSSILSIPETTPGLTKVVALLNHTLESVLIVIAQGLKKDLNKGAKSPRINIICLSRH